MDPINLFDFEALAQQRIPHNLWGFVRGGAADEITLERNRAAFDEITVNPRFLVDVSERDLSTTVLGRKISFPVMVAPAGGHREVHPDGELAVARAAGAAGTIMALPTGSGYSIEEVVEVATGPLWLQISYFGDEITELLVTRAKAAGYTAICLTIDTPAPSAKEGDLRNQFVRAAGLHWGSLTEYPDILSKMNPGKPESPDWSPGGYNSFTWPRLDWLRSLSGLPLVVKGVRTAGDAALCAEYGADGIIVSNHGGRQLDGTLSSIETLLTIVEAVGDSLEVYLDSGIRRGLDVLKALALGAVLAGRPVFWGLAVDGEAGVRKVLEILRVEFDRAMAYCGRTTVANIDRSLVSLPYPLEG